MNQIQPIVSTLQTTPEGFLNFFPKSDYQSWTLYISAWMVVGFGSLPQQDIFQRVMSAKSEKVAVRASLLASVIYICFAMIPLILGLQASILLKDFDLRGEHSQLLIPVLVTKFVSPTVQILFFSGLISAILSTASGAILAPSSILSENILKYFLKTKSDRNLLRLSRASVIIISIVSFLLAVGKPSIYALVEDSGGISLVSIFIPMVFGLWVKKTSQQAALLSLVTGLLTWVLLEIFHNDMTSHFYGTFTSLIGILLGIYLFPKPKALVPTTS